MKTNIFNLDTLRNDYLYVLLAVMGLAAFVAAVAIAWPALAYLGAKLA